ncbi:MAG TPA: Na+/H+ antiporter NhaA [Caulobacteraceae bacterium]
MNAKAGERHLRRAVDRKRDHVRGGGPKLTQFTVVVYSDYLCPYCRRLKDVLDRLREALGERLAYVYRHFPNERAHPGATLVAAAAEAAGRQGKFWEMHDALFNHEPSLSRQTVTDIAAGLGLDMARFKRDLDDPKAHRQVEEDLSDGHHSGVSATPTIFVDGLRYDGAWDFYSMLEAIERPVGARVQRTARAFANLPTSAGLVLLIAAAAALFLANSPMGPAYQQFVEAQFGIGPATSALSLSVADWCSEGLLAIFFLIVGLEIRREMTAGSLTDPRAAVAPVLAAFGGVIVPAAIYLAFNRGATAPGWSAPADTGIAFSLGILAVFGARASAGLKVFVATYAVVDDIISIVILAVFYPRDFHALWLIASAATIVGLVGLNRARVYTPWPYLTVAAALWLSLHLAGVNGALSGVALALFLPTRPTPSAGPLLAQAATALAELEQAEREVKRAGKEAKAVRQEPIWDWANRNLSAAAARLLSPAEAVERALAPWSTYVVLPLFAFTAAGVSFAADLAARDAGKVIWGVVLGLALGKPIGIVGATVLASRARIAIFPAGASWQAFLGAGFLCGIGDPVSMLLAEQAFVGTPYAAVAKVGVLLGSAAAVVLGVAALSLSPGPATAVAKPKVK